MIISFENPFLVELLKPRSLRLLQNWSQIDGSFRNYRENRK